MPGPSSRTETRPGPASASSSTQPGVRVRRARDVVEAGADHGDQLGGDLGGQLDGPGVDDLDAGPALEVDQRGAPGRPCPPAPGATWSCSRISVRSATSCSPASRPSSAASPAELGTPALHQREHLQHAVVDGAGQPGPLGRGGGVALGRSRSAAIRCSDSTMKPTIGPPISSRKTLP